MNIDKITNQSFTGQAIVLKRSQNRKELNKFAKELNKTNFVKNSRNNFYLAYGFDTFADCKCVKVFAKTGCFRFSEDYETMFFKGQNATLSLDSIIGTIKYIISNKGGL